ncbi:MAG: zinc-dependent alcohol dehydrogenase family protein [Flexistipes sinusarabici]|uniref:Zinc-dependent alcohol dehydrogenase family protein n=1 Tax=Flexistipes sinusarabici TaxID=2352 RepID=A0A5D0MKW9_FLESI|nr:zinc-dependent alcohol dehydrogenase family protein [Flexistipes sinusarabici]TYB33042.1 MAG: zinc-dependent alcohol dehydrogenase family protein [Flexistipes sinusarabici]
MKALVYYGPGKKSWEEKEIPQLQSPTDAVVRILKTTICGTDLHILKGDVPTCKSGTTLGHEGIGVIEEVGSAVDFFNKGDKVLISCITACARCEYCKRGMYSQCRFGGWILGNTIDGTQAEYVRIPSADTSLYPVAQGVDEDALVMLSDILPTGYECGVLNGKVSPGDTIAVIGAGPVGLASILTAQLYSPAKIIAIDLDMNRLDTALSFGATHKVISDANTVSEIMQLTKGVGVDVAIEAVGIPATFELCQEIIAPGGRIANVGVHGKPVNLHLEQLWAKNIAITTRLVDTISTPLLLKSVAAKMIDPAPLITHRFPLSDIEKAYDIFSNANREKAIKVLLEA